MSVELITAALNVLAFMGGLCYCAEKAWVAAVSAWLDYWKNTK